MSTTSSSQSHEQIMEPQEENKAEIYEPLASQDSRDIRGIKWALIVLAILSSTFFYGLDNTVAANVQPVIVTQFGALDRLPWISVAFLIGAASTNFFW
jgi:hypothetical protein